MGKLKTVLITESFGGQSVESSGIENWIGTVKIPGADFSQMLEKHLRAYAGDSVEIKTGERVTNLEAGLPSDTFKIETNKNVYETRAVLIATGSTRRKLEIPGAKEFENKGLTYCASCDGPLFTGQDVAIIGGGNAGFETAAQLLAYCKSVTLINRGETFRADKITVDKVLQKSPACAACGCHHCSGDYSRWPEHGCCRCPYCGEHGDAKIDYLGFEARGVFVNGQGKGCPA